MVAGTNYKILFAVDCNNGKSTMLEAQIFVPLPYTNQDPTVRPGRACLSCIISNCMKTLETQVCVPLAIYVGQGTR